MSKQFDKPAHKKPPVVLKTTGGKENHTLITVFTYEVSSSSMRRAGKSSPPIMV